MMSEALKKRILSSREFYTKKRWEGKPLSFRFKYALANYPEVLLTSVFFTVFCPIVCTYRYFNFEGSKSDILRKYKYNYKVIRDDDPNVEKYIQEKERGREYFPE